VELLREHERLSPLRRQGADHRLLAGEHLCGPSAAEAHEAVGEDCDVLHDEIATFLAGSRGLRQAAFAQWCREHGRCA
jgi:hypothetical protein